MKSKALGNLDVAQQLINKNQNPSCTASIHCSYYAVFQYMKHVLANIPKDPIPYEKQTKKHKGESSHDYMITQIGQRIKKTKNAREFKQGVRALKRERIIADYGTKKFTAIESLECKQKAEGLINNLKTYFGNI